MNSVDENPDYKGLYNEACKLFKKAVHFSHGPFDETFFTMRVFESAKLIISKLPKSEKNKCNEPLVLVSCILHDVGKSKMIFSRLFGKNGLAETFREEWRTHPKLSVPIAKRIMKKFGHSDEFIEQSSFIIRNHDNRGDRMDEKDRTLELKVMQDADLISDYGFAGFIRPFTFGGKYRRSIIESIKFLEKKESRLEVKGWINLPFTKKYAKEELKIQHRLVDEALKEINSELLK
jgi:HD superfamily phosphodiesterase